MTPASYQISHAMVGRSLRDELARCDAEIARCESQIYGEGTNATGALIGLRDWTRERRLIEHRTRPLAIELFCGSSGWGRGLAAAGWRVIGFDIEHLPHHGIPPEHCSIALQDVLTLHGSQFKDEQLIVASSPCQKYSWLAMPWSRSKPVPCPKCTPVRQFHSIGDGTVTYCSACENTGWMQNSKAAKELRRQFETEGPDNTLFNAARRIKQEAIKARQVMRGCTCQFGTVLSGKPACSECYIPLIQENVRGAQEWVGINGPCVNIPRHERNRLGRAKANYGSFYLWGDIGMVGNRIVANGQQLRVPRKAGKGTKPVPNRGWTAGCAITLGLENYNGNAQLPGQKAAQSGSWFRERDGVSLPGIRREGRAGTKKPGNGTSALWKDRPVPRFNDGETDLKRSLEDGTKIGGDWFSDPNSTCRKHGSRSNARKAASAAIAVIPFELAEFVGRAFLPASARSEAV